MLLVLFFLNAGTFAFAAFASNCASHYGALSVQPAEEVGSIILSTQDFDRVTQLLSSTLSGNLATVLRSEWKAKGPLKQSNTYISDLLGFLTEETKQAVTKDLDPKSEGYIRALSSRLYQLRGKPGDRLIVRDPPAPPGSVDTTFTFYAKAVKDMEGGKHQLRIRNYLRSVDPEKIEPGYSVEGFSIDGSKQLSIAKTVDGQFLVKSTTNGEASSALHTKQELTQIFGDPILLFAAPHGKKFKLEIKTRLKDSISGSQYPNLGGRNFVQKLDVNLSFAQIQSLFQPSPIPLHQRLATLRKDLLKDPKANEARIDAIFYLIQTAADRDPSFLRLEGATQYSRSAFEIEIPDTIAGQQVRVQTTIDRDLGAFREVYNNLGQLQNPARILALRQGLMRPADAAEQRHWELKVPKPLVERAAGQTVEVEPVSYDLSQLIRRFSLCDVTNRGKFVHICEQRPVDDMR